jgi:purine-binding chemotaxis protein CheW
MSKSLVASKKLMQTYLSELLTEEEVATVESRPVKLKQAQSLDKLLSRATFSSITEQEDDNGSSTEKTNVGSSVQAKTIVDKVVNKPKVEQTEAKLTPTVAPKSPIKSSIKSTVEVSGNLLQTKKSSGGFQAIKQKNYRQGDFQAMFFDVAGLLIAVPLIELGGIHNNDKTTALMGKPDWFRGVMLYRDEKVNVVDTARWVMPEKCNDTLISALDYKYIIMLNNSSWGLMAEKLVDTRTLKQEDVKWLDSSDKRPWLAGLVKDRMCALLDVESLIKLLDKGMDINAR